MQGAMLVHPVFASAIIGERKPPPSPALSDRSTCVQIKSCWLRTTKLTNRAHVVSAAEHRAAAAPTLAKVLQKRLRGLDRRQPALAEVGRYGGLRRELPN